MAEWPTQSSGVREKFEAARNLDLPVPPSATGTDHIRRRFFAGETLIGADIAEEFNASTPYLAQQISQMRKLGYEFENTPIEREGGNTTAYRLLNPDHEVDWDNASLFFKAKVKRKRDPNTPEARRKRESRALAKSKTEPKPANDAPPRVPDLPRLGDAVEVSLLALGADGDVRVGIRLNGQSWLLRLEGAT